MSAGRAADGEPLAGWDPRRRAALETIWGLFERAAGHVSLSDELIADRRREAAAEGAPLAE